MIVFDFLSSSFEKLLIQVLVLHNEKSICKQYSMVFSHMDEW